MTRYAVLGADSSELVAFAADPGLLFDPARGPPGEKLFYNPGVPDEEVLTEEDADDGVAAAPSDTSPARDVVVGTPLRAEAPAPGGRVGERCDGQSAGSDSSDPRIVPKTSSARG